mgnify:CR=1 FL=1|tara:strand:- start:391 stop:1335 length:945 start_codon:yes stop_codon:yes gene_type:complete
MKIVELILDEEQEDSGIDAISIVESPAIESDFVALNNQEIKLAELDKEKKILLGALLIPNKPIFRNGDEGDYYIFFSKETIVKASQMYLKNGYQNNSTLEHKDTLKGLTLVESWIVEDEVNDKSRKYGLDVPVGTWMGAVKVNNDEIWNEYVKSGKVKGFSIEGYFADKMERPKESIKEDMSEEKLAEQLLGKIESIVKGEKVELENKKIELVKKPAVILKDAQALDKTLAKSSAVMDRSYLAYVKAHEKFDNELVEYNKKLDVIVNDSKDVRQAIMDLGLSASDVPELVQTGKLLPKLDGILGDYKKLYPKIN